MRPFSLTLGAADIETIIAALEASQEHSLARRVERQVDLERKARAGQEEAAAALADYRAKRAEHHILTKRQAECLAAVRAGKRPSEQPWFWTDDMGVKQWRWRYGRSMGGAINRMVETLIDEGLITDNARTLTDAGLARLEAWEAKHGRIGEEAA